MATLKDVAQRAGVSVSTVSRVFSGTAFVEEGTKARVLEVAEELNWRIRRRPPDTRSVCATPMRARPRKKNI